MITDVKEAIRDVLLANLNAEIAAESARLGFSPALPDFAEIVLSEQQGFIDYPVIRIYSQKTDRDHAKSASTTNVRKELVKHVLNLDVMVQASSPDSALLERQCEAYMEAVRKAVYKNIITITGGTNVRQLFFNSYIYSDIFQPESDKNKEIYRKDVYGEIEVEEITVVL